jgi:hypothetical protein
MSYVHRKFIRQGTPRQILVKGRAINIFRGKMAKKSTTKRSSNIRLTSSSQFIEAMDKTSNTTPLRTLKAVVPGEDEAHFVLIERYFS